MADSQHSDELASFAETIREAVADMISIGDEQEDPARPNIVIQAAANLQSVERRLRSLVAQAKERRDG